MVSSNSVPEDIPIYELRPYIIDVCGEDDDFPKKFIYLRSVGRCLAKVKPHQEKQLKVKNYRPPVVGRLFFLFLVLHCISLCTFLSSRYLHLK